MSRAMDIFVNTEQSLEDFTKDLERLVKISAKRRATEDEVWYELEKEHMFLSVGEHEYVNDKGIPFEQYRYDIEVHIVHITNGEERLKWQHEVGYMIFVKLKEQQKYSLMLVDNLGRILDTYTP